MSGRLEQAIGTVDGSNRDFSVSTAYAPGTLVLFLNGRQLKRELENGWEEIDPSSGTFRTKLPPEGPHFGGIDDPGDILYCYYDEGTSVSVGGAQTGGIPNLFGATELRPSVEGGNVLSPSFAGSEDLVLSVGSPGVGAGELQPSPEVANELRPRLANATEV